MVFGMYEKTLYNLFIGENNVLHVRLGLR